MQQNATAKCNCVRGSQLPPDPLSRFKGAAKWQVGRGREGRERRGKEREDRDREGGKGGKGSGNRAADWLRPALTPFSIADPLLSGRCNTAVIERT